jgi:hypothetical protein
MVSNSLVVSGSVNGIGAPLFEVRELVSGDNAYFIVSSGSINHLTISRTGVLTSTGSLFVSNSLTTGTVFTASLQQGYSFVGGANNISTITTTASFAPTMKSGQVLGSTFATDAGFSNTYTAQITFTTAYSDLNYGVQLTASGSARSWEVLAKNTTGFKIGTNSTQAVESAATVFWLAMAYSNP